jgi:lipopolysaccharide export system protein LptC
MAWLPLLLLSAVLLLSIWLVRSTPVMQQASLETINKQEPDYDIRRFLLKTYDLQGKLKSSMTGLSAVHSPQTMTTLVEEPRVVIFKEKTTTLASANRALANEDGSEVQLMGHAVVHRNPSTEEPNPLRVQSDFLHFFADTDSVQTTLPVEISKGKNNFKGSGMKADNFNQVLVLKGRVKAVMYPEPAP